MRSKKAIKNIMFSLILQLVTILCGLIVPRMIIGTYGSSVNGLITSITQFLAYITLLESGIGPVIRALLYKPLANKDNDEIVNILSASERFFRKIALIFVVYIIVLCCIYPLFVAGNFDYMFTVSLILIIAISTFAEYFFGMTYRMLLVADQKTYVYSIIQVLTLILNTITMVVFIKLGFNIQIVKLIGTLTFVLRPILQNLYVKRKYKIDLSKADKNYKLKNKWDGLAQHIASVVHNNTDIAVLTIFSSVLEVSVYSVYQLVIKGIKSLVSALTGGVDASFGDMLARGEYEHLKKSFSTYEFFYFSLITIIYTCTLVLIVPFVSVYTDGITDVDYIRPLFAFLIVFAEFMHSIRLPYSSLVLAAGHFKETMKGAWLEAFINLFLSIVLVFKFGIVGVAIGTLIAMIIRTIEFNYHTSKYILKRDVKYGFIKPIISLIETSVIYVIFVNSNMINVTNYIDWLFWAIIIFIITSIVVIGINCLIYRDDRKQLLNLIKKNIKFSKN